MVTISYPPDRVGGTETYVLGLVKLLKTGRRKYYVGEKHTSVTNSCLNLFIVDVRE